MSHEGDLPHCGIRRRGAQRAGKFLERESEPVHAGIELQKYIQLADLVPPRAWQAARSDVPQYSNGIARSSPVRLRQKKPSSNRIVWR